MLNLVEVIGRGKKKKQNQQKKKLEEGRLHESNEFK